MSLHMCITYVSGKPGLALWRCEYCKIVSTLEHLDALKCSYFYPPCESCGETSECAPDCAGLAALLAGAVKHGVDVVEAPDGS